MRQTLGFYYFVHNIEQYDYPLIESVRSINPVADEIIICECESTDGTLKLLEKLRDEIGSKLKVIYHPWVTDFRQLSSVGNYAGSFLKTDWKWHFQADEVLHENYYKDIAEFLNTSLQSYSTPGNVVNAVFVNYNHFLGNYNTLFKFCYQRIVRISKHESEWKLSGDACHLDYGNPSQVIDFGITVFHYGKVHSGGIGWRKEWDFQQLFKSEGFPDPKMMQMKDKLGEEFCDYVYLFQQDIRDGKTWKFEGTHPKVMEERIKKFKDDGWEQFNSKIIEGLTLL